MTGSTLTPKATASPKRVIATGLMSTAGWNRTVRTCFSCGSRCRSTVCGTRSKLGAILMPTITSDFRDEIRKTICRGAEQASDVMDQVRGVSGLLNDPPYDEDNCRICEDLAELHCRLPG